MICAIACLSPPRCFRFLFGLLASPQLFTGHDCACYSLVFAEDLDLHDARFVRFSSLRIHTYCFSSAVCVALLGRKDAYIELNKLCISCPGVIRKHMSAEHVIWKTYVTML